VRKALDELGWAQPRKRDAMKALVYQGPGHKEWTDVPDPTVQADTSANKVVLTH